jgi:hypothetical protein
MPDLSPEVTMVLVGTTGALLLVLIVSVLSRPRIFTQYLEHMTGIKLSPSEVAKVFKARGKAGVRDMFLELIIREDLKDGPTITPDTPPDREILAP